jgi:SAM-dependent methyltransferase
VPADPDLRAAWDAQAHNWIRWCRESDEDSFYRFHGERFFSILPAPGRLTIDLGSGEGRVARALRKRGHEVVEIEGSPTLARASRELSGSPVANADVARLPVRTGVADLAIAFMSFQDVDAMPAAVAEAARILEPNGVFAFAIVHPLNSGGAFAPGPDEMAREFVMTEPYFEDRHYAEDIDKGNGRVMRFESRHRPLEDFSRALEPAGFVIEAVREVTDVEGKWTKYPLFLDIRARKVRLQP